MAMLWCRKFEEEVDFPMGILLRALQPALKLPLPLAQWPLQLLYAACMVSFPSVRARVWSSTVPCPACGRALGQLNVLSRHREAFVCCSLSSVNEHRQFSWWAGIVRPASVLYRAKACVYMASLLCASKVRTACGTVNQSPGRCMASRQTILHGAV